MLVGKKFDRRHCKAFTHSAKALQCRRLMLFHVVSKRRMTNETQAEFG
jgi:hypothetical protein